MHEPVTALAIVKYDLEKSENNFLHFYSAPRIDEWGECIWECIVAEGGTE